MQFFSKEETKKIGIILAILVLVSVFNFGSSLKKGRDARRNGDLTFLREKLEEYRSEIGYFPPSGGDGTILACRDSNTILNMEFKRLENPAPCKWGQDGLINYFSDTPKTLLEKLPLDPHGSKGLRYIYRSSPNRFQLYASLENKADAEYNLKIEALEIKCGSRLCNFGKAFSDTPLDKTIQEYENELLNK